MPNFISEDQIEQALVQKLQHLHGFDALDCYTENAEDLNDGPGRTSKRDGIPVEFDNAQRMRQQEHVRLLDMGEMISGCP